MDGTYNFIPDLSTNTKVYTTDAPQQIMDINHHLVNYILDMDGKGQGVHDTINAGVSKFTGWKSFDSSHMQHLLDWIGYEITNNFMTQIKDFLPVFSQVWGMEYNVNDVTPAHSHEPALVSFTYYPYIENPEIAQPLEICTFPDGSIEMDLSMCADHVQEKTHQWGKTMLSIPPHTGQLVVFPAYCFHQVKPVTVKTDRYCIAGNIHHDFENQPPHWD
tara:strand:+ start:950 stop:1603 length:654 start_codon:yes stop_codon:yes gene_type:complete